MADKNAQLIALLDDLFTSLREESRPDKLSPDGQVAEGPKVGFVDRLKLMEVGTRWVQVRNRIEPPDESDPFTEQRNKLIRGSRGRRPAGTAAGVNGAG